MCCSIRLARGKPKGERSLVRQTIIGHPHCSRESAQVVADVNSLAIVVHREMKPRTRGRRETVKPPSEALPQILNGHFGYA